MRAGSRSACENERAFTFWEEEKARKRKVGESHPLTENNREGYTSLLHRKHNKITMNYYMGMIALFSGLTFSGW